jgi:dCMP deaminase
MSTITLRPVKCVKCDITFSTHSDFLNHLTAIERHNDMTTTSENLRPGWDAWALGIAQAVSARGECTRARVGALLVDFNHRIMSAGYNGAPPGQPSCLDGVCPRAQNGVERGTLYDGPGSCIAIHAEVNCLSDATERGIIVMPGWTLYITKEPCEICMKYLEPYGLRIVWRDLSR